MGNISVLSDNAISLKPDHISAYDLTYEDDTAFFEDLKRGDMDADEDRDATQFFLAHDLLSAAGFEHYETSNYARPGFRSSHNRGYWRGEDLLFGDAPRDLPREAGAAGQDGVDDGPAASRGERGRDPVADGREVLRPRGRVPEPARDLGEPLAVLVVDAVDVGVRGRYPRGAKTFSG